MNEVVLYPVFMQITWIIYFCYIYKESEKDMQIRPVLLWKIPLLVRDNFFLYVQQL